MTCYGATVSWVSSVSSGSSIHSPSFQNVFWAPSSVFLNDFQTTHLACGFYHVSSLSLFNPFQPLGVRKTQLLDPCAWAGLNTVLLSNEANRVLGELYIQEYQLDMLNPSLKHSSNFSVWVPPILQRYDKQKEIRAWRVLWAKLYLWVLPHLRRLIYKGAIWYWLLAMNNTLKTESYSGPVELLSRSK